MKKQILITIGREYGSGGHDLAVLLSQRLGIRMLDRELIDELWKNDPEMQRLAQEYDERPVNRILSRKINEFDNSIPHNVAQRQFDMIRQIADSGTISPWKRPRCWWPKPTGTAGFTTTTTPASSGATAPAMT